LFNTTLKLSEINQISAIKKELPTIEAGLSSANSNVFCNEMLDLQAALSNNGQMHAAERTGEIFNIGSISQDDAESIINMLKDHVTVKLGNGNEIKIPKLNLDVLPGAFPEEVKNQLGAQLAQLQSVSENQVVSEISSPISPDSALKNQL
jgi:hypothetical protein